MRRREREGERRVFGWVDDGGGKRRERKEESVAQGAALFGIGCAVERASEREARAILDEAETAAKSGNTLGAYTWASRPAL